MSEQLWYTWSTMGFGTANGNRVRAASSNLTDVEGQRVRAFVNLVSYTLSQDVDPFLPPSEAPLCLAFLKAGFKQEEVLIQKTYIGLDGVRRPGAFFSHLITDLPPVPSQCPDGQVPFSAREAIALWRATALWRDTEQDWPAGKRDLEAIAPTDLYLGKYIGSLNEQVVMRMPDLFSLVMQAFLTLALSGERKRLYLAGSPDTVAALIWGITHALPRTLTIMRNMTFSTFEADVETDAKPLIVGTCWLPQYLKKGHENALLNLPPQYYQLNNPYGFAIDCDSPQKRTPFTPHELVIKYTQFVLTCFSQGNMGMTRLMLLLDKAEKRNISDAMGFLNHFVEFNEMLNKEAVMRLLQNLHNKVEALVVRAETTLQQDKLQAAAAEAAQVGSIQAEAEILKQENVQQSILLLMTQEPTWWKNQGQVMIGRLYELAVRYSKDQLAEMGNRFTYKIISSKQWNKNQGADIISAVQQLVQDYSNYRTPQDILAAFTKSIERSVIDAQKELKNALFPLAASIADLLVQAMRDNQYDSMAFWNEAFAACVNLSRIPTDVWAYLLQQLATGVRYTNTYKEWWTKYSKQRIGQLRPYVAPTSGTTIANAFSTFTSYAAHELAATIQADDITALSFWADVFDITAPPESEPNAWASLLNQLGGISYTAAYALWYKDYGRARLRNIILLANQKLESELGRSFSSFIQQAFFSLQSAIQSGHTASLVLWEGMLVNVAPHSSQPYLWMDLLLNLRAALTTPGFSQWWNDQGRDVTRALRALTETNKANIVGKLTAFAQAVADLLAKYIIEEASQGHHEYEASIAFFFKVLDVAVPAQDTTIWLTLLQKLSHAYAYKTASWELRSVLLQQWKSVAALRSNEAQSLLHPWFEVSWNDLDRFLSLDLPDTSCKIAITRALEAYTAVPTQQILDIVKRYPDLFEDVLQVLLKAPQKQFTTVAFFALLAQNAYPRTISLLDRLLTASGYQKDIAERLLQAAQLISTEDIVNLLEQHCKDLLANYELPPTMLRLIESYFANFDVEFLDTNPTRTLLSRLQQREKVSSLRLPPPIQQSVEGWYKVTEFLTQPQASHNSLRELSHRLKDIAQIAPGMWKKLATKLIPSLVELVTTEADLARVIDNLGRGTELELLQDMARVAGEKYGQERPPVRIAPYVRMVLGEARYLESPKKEQFLDLCFQMLFKHIDEKTRDKFRSDALWTKAFGDEWKSSITRMRNADLKQEFNRFKQAINNVSVPGIMNTYKPAFEQSLNQQEHQLWDLASRFTVAYRSDNDVAIVQAHEALEQYFHTPRYTQEQVDRIQLARQRIAVQQQAQAQQAVVNSSNPASTWSPNMSNSAPTPAMAGPSQPSTPLQNMAQSEPAGSQRYAAKVKSWSITSGALDWTVKLKTPYLKLRRELLQQRIQQIEETEGSTQKKALRLMKQEVKSIEKLLKDEEHLRQTALHDLIDDVLIQEEITQLSKSQAVWTQFDIDIENKLNRVYQEITLKYISNSSPLRLKDADTVETVKAVLRVFIRREAFDDYLSTTRRQILEDWLKEQRQQEKVNIIIDYEQARLNPPRGWNISILGLSR